MARPSTLVKIVSGGQTGVDRAALDVALELGLARGGWCPLGRIAEDGVIAHTYPLLETETAAYAERTRLNVRDSDATLVLARGRPQGGTALTLDFARRQGRPSLVVDLDAPQSAGAWLEARGVVTLNVAGPRQSTAPGIYEEASKYLRELLA